jgi:hypothetical protein
MGEFAKDAPPARSASPNVLRNPSSCVSICDFSGLVFRLRASSSTLAASQRRNASVEVILSHQAARNGTSRVRAACQITGTTEQSTSSDPSVANVLTT